MKQSRIFTKAELESLDRRIKGKRYDPHGIYAARVKPKIIELFEWFGRIKELTKLLKVKK